MLRYRRHGRSGRFERDGGMSASPLALSTPSSIVLRDAMMLDAGGGFAGPTDCSVTAGVIEAIGQNLRVSADTQELDCTGLWLIPGVFDCHTHVSSSTVDKQEILTTPVTQWALATGQNLRRIVECGVTYTRDAGGADSGFRAAVNSGLIPGPRLALSVNMLSQTGGHSDEYLAGTGMEWSGLPGWPGRPSCVVDGVDEMRKATRQLLRAGADWIKICTTGGVVSSHDAPDEPQFTPEEIAVAVHEARRKGRFVMAHAFGGPGLHNAVRAGVRSIEHGLLLTEEDAAEMAEAGCYLIPTLSILHRLLEWLDSSDGGPPLSANSLAKAQSVRPLLGNAVRVAREAGVPLAVGTDFISREMHGHNLEELSFMHQAGLPVEEVLLAATCGGAALCGVDETLGRFAPGYVFDAVIFDRDLGDLSMLQERGSVKGVFKSGQLIVWRMTERDLVATQEVTECASST